MPLPSSFLWHDYETTGIDARRERPTQFAAIRTDANLNEIDEPIDLLCRLPEDIIGSPKAALLTGLFPHRFGEEALNEADFARRIHEEMIQPGTCCVGFNTLRFDDEFTRNMLYRNFLDPYEREYANGNSRWDLIDVVRTCHAFRPEGWEWPHGEDGLVSFKLEDLARANGLRVDSAHDALSDVRTTLEVARLVRRLQPRLFDHMLGLRDKKTVLPLLQDPARKVLLHVASCHGKEHNCVGLVVPLGPHPTNKNAFLVADLSGDLEEWMQCDAEDLAQKLSWSPTTEEKRRPAVRVIQANKCPALFGAGLLRENASRFPWVDFSEIEKKWRSITQATDWLNRLQVAIAINEEKRPPAMDPEFDIYGGFISNADKGRMKQVHLCVGDELASRRFNFSDPKLDVLLFRFRARNYPETLSVEERGAWQSFCCDRLTREEGLGPRTLAQFTQELDEMVQAGKIDEASEELVWLRQWAREKQAWIDQFAPLQRPAMSC